MHLVLGDGQELLFRTADFIHYHRTIKNFFEFFARNVPTSSEPEPCQHCTFCDWKDHCEAVWERKDHLSLVANIQRSQIQKLRAAGVLTVRTLAELPATVSIPKIQVETLERLRSQATLQVTKRDTGKDCKEILAVLPDQGFERLPEPALGDLYFDIEGDPLYDNGLEYLFALLYLVDGKPRFVAFWAHDRSAEKRAFENAVDFMMAHFTKYSKAYVYHYGNYEESALKRLASLHGTREAPVDNLLRTGKLIDIYKVVRKGVRTSKP
jgi:uncharacterized protein